LDSISKLSGKYFRNACIIIQVLYGGCRLSKSNIILNPTKNTIMVTKGLLARLEAKPDKVEQVKAFLESAEPIVENEPETIAWFAIQLGPTSFGIFDVSPDEDGRQAHLNGDVAAALMEKASDLFAGDPDIKELDILADKMP
jgi:quinol monooxygenase YgiN